MTVTGRPDPEVTAGPPVLRTRAGHVETWTLNRPERRNTVTDEETIGALEDCVAAANADPSVRAVVLTGAGSAFCAGGDLKQMAAGGGAFGGSPDAMAEAYRSGVQRIPRALATLAVPIVAAVNGPAVGAGCDLAAMCDLRIASSRAFFAESFVALGLVSGDGGTWFLRRVVGDARAAQMALTGARVDASTALAWGLVSAVVEPEDLMGRAGELAARVAAHPPHAVRLTKRLLAASAGASLEDTLTMAALMQATAQHTADHREALAALLEKREAVFTGS